MLDVIYGASSSCRGTSQDATASAEFIVAPGEVTRCNVNGRVLSSCRTTRVLDEPSSCRGTSPCTTSSTSVFYVVWLDVAWRVVVRSIAAEFFVVPCDVAGRDNLPWCHGTSPGEASSEESFSVPWDVGARRYRRSVFRCIARRRWANVDGLDVIGGVAYVVPRDVAMRDLIDGAASLCCGMWPGATSLAETFVAPWEVARCDVNGRVFSSCRSSPVLDVIDGAFRRAAGRRRARRHRRNLFRCVVGRCRARCHQRILPSCHWTSQVLHHQRSLLLCHGMSGLDVICGVISSLSQGVAGRTSPGSTSSAEFLSYVVLRDVAVRDVIYGAPLLCCGTSPGATSSAESIVVLQDVAGLRVSSRIAGSRRVQRSRWGLFVLLDVAGLDVIDGAFRRAAGRRRV